MPSKITLSDLKRARADVIQMIDGSQKVGRASLKIFWYPAVLFPKRRPVLIQWKRGKTAAAKSYDEAFRIAEREITRALSLELRRILKGRHRRTAS